MSVFSCEGAVGRSGAALGLVWDWGDGNGSSHCREVVPSPGGGEGVRRAMGTPPALARSDFPPVIKRCGSF